MSKKESGLLRLGWRASRLKRSKDGDPPSRFCLNLMALSHIVKVFRFAERQHDASVGRKAAFRP